MLASAFNKRQYCWFVNVQCGAETLEEFNLHGQPFAVVLPLRPLAQLHGSARLLLHGDIMEV